jgi:cyclase
MKVRTVAIVSVALMAAGTAMAQDFDVARVETQRLGDGFYVLFAVGGDVVAGNLAVTIGEDGVLLVDAQFAELAPKYKAAIAELGGTHIDLLINTHWHFDHTDGNKVLGPDGATIIAQDVSRRMLLHDNVVNVVTRTVDQAALGPDALPVITYGHAMSLHFNGEQIDLLHFGPAHTAGDTAVVFRGRDAVHLGDVFNTAGYPFIDADNGGSLRGIIEFCSAVLEQIDRTAVVIPGHGPVSDYQGLRDYVAMLSEIHDRMSALISSGATLEQVLAARITADWDEERGDPDTFVNRAYTSMTR